MRDDLEAGNLGFDREVEMIRIAGGLDLLTTAYVCTPDEAAAMVAAGVDIVVAHLGLTVGGAIGATHAINMEVAVQSVSAIAEASRRARKDVFVVAHGGPITSPDDAANLFRMCAVDGFVGASSMERLPIEEPLRANTAAFAKLRVRPWAST
jgi:predicted TIM-barrel enzyme